MTLNYPFRAMSGATFLSVALLCMLQASQLFAQTPPPPAEEQLNFGPALTGAAGEPEPLLRGPVHEAFAEPYSADPQPGAIVPKQPPAPIEELPPDTKPAGETVEWIPGYWGWDEERQDFLWVSGLWRTPPPNHRWVPGYWYQVDTGYQWVVGTWVRDTVEEIEYLAEAPPQTLEQGPVGEAPADNYFWIPGCWTWGGTNYLWRPGYWSVGYNNWIWTPSRYYWTPYGYAYTRGFWDRPFIDRGYLFAPYYFPQRSYLNVGFRFTPGISLSVGLLTNNFWVAPRYGHYYFGDYYSNFGRYGFEPWHRYHYTRRGYDPIFAHYQRHHHHGGHGNWNDRDRQSNYYRLVNDNFQQRVDNKDRRPPHTWSEQIARYGRGDNDGRDFNRDRDRTGSGGRGPENDRFDNAIGRSWNDFAQEGTRAGGNRPGSANFAKLSDAQRDQLRKQSNAYRQLSEQRRDTESNRGQGRPNFEGKVPGSGKIPDGVTGNRNPGGSRIVGDAGDGVQNRFRLPTPDGATRTGGKVGDGNRPDLDRNRGSGDISSTIRGNQEALERAKDRFRSSAGQPGDNGSGKKPLGTTGSGRPGSGSPANIGGGNSGGSGNRSQAFQDAIDKARRERDGSTKTDTGKPALGGNNLGSGNRGGNSDGNRPQFDRSKLDRSQIDGGRSGRGNSEGFNPGNSKLPENTVVPRSTNRPGNVPGTTSTSPGNRSDSVQSAIDRARKAMSERSGAGSGAPTGGSPAVRSGGSADRIRSFNPPNTSQGTRPGTTRTITPPSGNPAGKVRSFTPPNSGGDGASRTRSFTPPSGGSRSFERGSTERSMPKPSGDSSSSRFRSGTSTTPGAGTGSSFRSAPRPTSDPAAAVRSFGGGGVSSRAGTSGSSARSFTPPSGGGPKPTINRSSGGPSRSSEIFRGAPTGGSKESGSSSSSRSRRNRD